MQIITIHYIIIVITIAIHYIIKILLIVILHYIMMMEMMMPPFVKADGQLEIQAGSRPGMQAARAATLGGQAGQMAGRPNGTRIIVYNYDCIAYYYFYITIIMIITIIII